VVNSACTTTLRNVSSSYWGVKKLGELYNLKPWGNVTLSRELWGGTELFLFKINLYNSNPRYFKLPIGRAKIARILNKWDFTANLTNLKKYSPTGDWEEKYLKSLNKKFVYCSIIFNNHQSLYSQYTVSLLRLSLNKNHSRSNSFHCNQK
jgi:hypothetical protein